MCDQDHFEQDREQYEALGLVTRKQFGVLLGAGMAMMLPQVANAFAVTESEVSVTTPDGAADCYFAHPASGAAPGVLVWQSQPAGTAPRSLPPKRRRSGRDSPWPKAARPRLPPSPQKIHSQSFPQPSIALPPG